MNPYYTFKIFQKIFLNLFSFNYKQYVLKLSSENISSTYLSFLKKFENFYFYIIPNFISKHFYIKALFS